MEEENRPDFKTLLDNNHEWPCDYLFKFIVFSDLVEELTGLLNTDRVSLRPSKNGRYTSVSVTMKMSSSDEVLFIYEKVRNVKGIISL